MATEINTPETSILSQEIGALQAQLAPADDGQIAKYLLSMRRAGMVLPLGIRPEDLEPVYGFALSGTPAAALKRVVEKLIRGEYQLERGFIPRPPELAELARTEVRHQRADLLRLTEKQRALQELSQARARKPDPEACARVRARLDAFRAAHAAQKLLAISEPKTPAKRPQQESGQ
jgi:hypothetical protein